MAVAMPIAMEIVEAAPNRYRVTGALTFETARRAREAGLKLLESSASRDPLVLDCSGVGESDSAGLAMLIDFLRNAEARGRAVEFVNLPPGILAAANISEVTPVLGV
jgi:phospholipid transport system transporter-binding protein